MLKRIVYSLLLVGLVSLIGCEKDSTTSSNTNTSSTTATTTTTSTTSTTASTDPLAIYKMLYGATSVSQSGDNVVIKCTGVPDHKSPYFKGTQWESTKYESDTMKSFKQNPNTISSFSMTFTIPMNPKEASTKAATPLGPIGVALNGVPFFNQYAAMRAALTNEIYGFDQYNGHPQQQGQYHYHIEPVFLTAMKGKSALMGFLLDGFPVYGPLENGKTLVSSDLDAYHGHSGPTKEYPSGIYHYHLTADNPYLNGNGFFGTAGTVTY
jgi:YHYH protein